MGFRSGHPGNDAYVTLLPENLGHDAQVEVEGFSARSFRVEVTTIETEQSTLRRQELSRKGTVVLTGRIRRKRDGSIEAEPEMIDVSEQEEIVVDLTLKRLRDKTESNRYDDKTSILVYVNDFWPLPAEGRLSLRRRTEQYLREQPAVFAVCYCYSPDFAIDWIEVGKRRLGARVNDRRDP